jgi:hypothetical protein
MKKTLAVIALSFVFIAMFANTLQAQLIAPQGRLTLVTNTPVITTDVTNATTVYYTPYQGNTVPVFNSGTSTFSPMAFSQLQLNLSTSNQTSNNIYDLFIGLGSLGGGPTALYLCAGPAWSSLTSRGTGAALAQWNGLWVNAATISCYNQAGTASGPADYFDYVGSVYMTSNGATSMQFQPAAASGGTNNFIGLYNAYNRVKVTGFCLDNTSGGWTYGTSSWRAANNSSSNQISFLDGLQQSPVTAQYSIDMATTVDSTTGLIGLNLDSSTATPVITGQMSSAAGETSSSQVTVFEPFYPVLGLHYIQAVEYSSGSSTAFISTNRSNQTMALTVSLDM